MYLYSNFTRDGYDWTRRYPWIVEAALKNRIKHFVIDGEAVILDVEKNGSRHHRTVRRAKPLARLTAPELVAFKAQ